jgi:prolyl-tRNA synthetase
VNVNEKSLSDAAEELYRTLTENGVEVIVDDRDERAGVKFKDADLIGIPYRVTVGPKRLAEGKMEIKNRRSGDIAILPVSEVAPFLMARIREGL